MLGGPPNDLDALVHQATDFISVVGFIVMSPDGIPVKYHEKMEYGQVLIYANLVSEYQLRAKRVFYDLFGKSDGSELESFRIRAGDGTEILVSTHNDFILLVIQDCSTNLKRTND